MATAGGAVVSPFIAVPLFFPFVVEINCVQLRRLPNLFALHAITLRPLQMIFPPKLPRF